MRSHTMKNTQGVPVGRGQTAPESDPVGIQTQDLQNRNLTLYSAKLRDQCCKSGGKGTNKRAKNKIKSRLFNFYYLVGVFGVGSE